MVVKELTLREAATRLKVGKTALYKALREQDAQTLTKTRGKSFAPVRLAGHSEHFRVLTSKRCRRLSLSFLPASRLLTPRPEPLA